MVSETLWVYIKVTVSLAIWTVSRVFKQLNINYYGHGLRFYMASYYGDNIHGNLNLPKSVLTSFFLHRFRIYKAHYSGYNIPGKLDCTKGFLVTYYSDTNAYSNLVWTGERLALKLLLLVWFHNL